MLEIELRHSFGFIDCKKDMMNIQINTDKNIEGKEELAVYLKTLIEEKFNRFSEHITRVEVHLSDENGSKEGADDKRCLLEVRPEKMPPIAVTEMANTIHNAVEGAIAKAKKVLESKLDKIAQH